MLRVLSVFAFATFMVLDAGEVVGQQYGQGNLPNHLFSQYATAPGASQATAGLYRLLTMCRLMLAIAGTRIKR